MLRTSNDFVEAAAELGLGLDLGRELHLDPSGADFLVAHAWDESGTAWILRSPRRPDVLHRAAMERVILDLVRRQSTVTVPEWRYFTPNLIAYPRLSGDPAATIDLSAGGYVWRFDTTNPPAEYLASLGKTLASIHQIDPREATEHGVPSRTPEEARQLSSKRIESARESLRVPEAVWSRWQRWLQEDAYWPQSSTFVHGDLHPPHVLIDGDHRVNGVLDWTEAQVGDPAMDFTLHYATLGEKPLEELLRRYQLAGGRVWNRMREHVVETWAAYPGVLAEFALTSGEEAPLQLAQGLLDAQAS